MKVYISETEPLSWMTTPAQGSVSMVSSLLSSEADFGSCVEISGTLVKSHGPSQSVELKAENIKVKGICDGMVSFPFDSNFSVWRICQDKQAKNI